MADLETKVEKLDERVTGLERRVSVIETKVEDLIDELRDFKNEIRDRDNQRTQDIREIRSSIDSMGKHVRNLAITSMAAIGAMVVTVIISILKS